jgi:hypothetical protein
MEQQLSQLQRCSERLCYMNTLVLLKNARVYGYGRDRPLGDAPLQAKQSQLANFGSLPFPITILGPESCVTYLIFQPIFNPATLRA